MSCWRILTHWSCPTAGWADGRTRVAMAADGTVVCFISSLPCDGSALELEDLVCGP
jgi:hypothetical protein